MKLKEEKLKYHRKTKVCHFSSLHQQHDARIFYKECTSLVKGEYQVCLIFSGGKKGVFNSVKVISYLKLDRRLLRILFSPFIIIFALKQKADIYHFYDPELIPHRLDPETLISRKGY